MNVKEYISSGIVESYVMGMVTDAERQEFESLCAQYPEIAAARNAFELALEEQILADSRQPPQHIKQLVEEKLTSNKTESYTVDQEEERAPVRSMGIWKWLAAASVILMAGAVYWAISSNNKYENLVAERDDLKNQLSQTAAQAKELEEMKKAAEIITGSGVTMAAMKGIADPRSYATVYWDSTTKDVYLWINNLPEPASDKQYQLWAIMDKKPINLGGVEVTSKRLFYKMQNVQQAQVFAITIEPKGSNLPEPTTTPIAVKEL